ncbi:TKL/IRAK protein kinase, variant 1 [Capsaspora owczarzaki ATCC 30864]|uniref:TKL/IRAK protein kinase n=2 Tax=Capsaspora owczarzaki (strain ATCC 30864) TaxID=595528 RepID=A0A0D2X1L2_CAPO3|nr:TKL/IRAK protein kinase [Capsaspora owczarzaki ATCC 30864]KJE91005.1 TKL/IRAK protein kinase, variant 1 [Capsaspora owczarzaki ATCC 30864]
MAIADALKTNRTVKELFLAKNQIGDAGTLALAEALKANKTVRTLYLSDNRIGDAGAQALAEALTVNETLTFLRMDKNILTSAGITALTQTGNAVCKLDGLDNQRVPSPAELAQNQSAAAARAAVTQPSANLQSAFQFLRSDLAAKSTLLDSKLAAKAQQVRTTKAQERTANGQELAPEDQQLRSKLAVKEAELATKEQELKQLRSSLAAKVQELATKDQELAAKDQTPKELELAAKEQELKQLRSSLAAKVQELATKDQELAAKDQTPKELELAAKEQELKQLRSSLAAKDQELAAKDRKLKSALDRIDVFERNQASVHGPIPKVPFTALVTATNNFSEDSLLGVGAFGRVHSGSLPGPPVAVAIKKLLAESIVSYTAFQSELDSLSKFRHQNIITILACAEGHGAYCLVYEFMPNGSVRDRLDCTNNTPPLAWTQRHRIAADVSRGMNYVQTAFFPDHVLFHRDLKTDNVLLDAHFNAKVSDFGLVRDAPHFDDKKSLHTKNFQGTGPYMCPQLLESGRMTIKTDVYAFGMILLELTTADKPGIGLKSKARKAVRHQTINDMLDPALNTTDAERPLINELVTLALECLEDDADDRPSFNTLLATLNPE